LAAFAPTHARKIIADRPGRGFFAKYERRPTVAVEDKRTPFARTLPATYDRITFADRAASRRAYGERKQDRAHAD